jgi:hypothetical protein
MTGLRRDEPVQPYGRYGFQTVNGFFENQPSFGFDAHTLFDAPLQTHWLYGSFQVVGTDRYYAVLKHYNTTGTLALMMYEADGRRDFQNVPQAKTAYCGGCYTGRVDGRWGMWDYLSLPDDPRFTLNVAPDGTTQWVEKGLVDVVGEQVGAVMQSTVVDTVSPMTYTSRCTRIHGRVLGDEVTGFLFQDFHHLPAGQDWIVTEFFNGVQGLWVVGATEYEDGECDITNFFWGRGGFASALVQRSSGERLASTDYSVEVDFDTDNDGREFVAEARFILAPEEIWTWTYRYPDTHSPKFPPMRVPGSPHWNEGVVTRVGEPRAWKASDAWMEIYPSTLKAILEKQGLTGLARAGS